MVRFFWHVEDGFNAFIPPSGMTFHADTSIQHVVCEIEVPGQAQTVQACFTIPATYLQGVKEVGVVLGHGANANDWKGRLLTDMAVALAKAGFVVMRYFCSQKEQRRQRMYEKALDACATSPFARGVQRWVLAGVGNGARIAAAVGGRCRGEISGFVFMSYPLQEPMPQLKGTSAPDSSAPLLKLKAPLLFMLGEQDPLCSEKDLQALLPRLPCEEVCAVTLQGMEGDCCKAATAHVTRQACIALLEFVIAIENESLETCRLTRIKGVQPTDKAEIPAMDLSHIIDDPPAAKPARARTGRGAGRGRGTRVAPGTAVPEGDGAPVPGRARTPGAGRTGPRVRAPMPPGSAGRGGGRGGRARLTAEEKRQLAAAAAAEGGEAGAQAVPPGAAGRGRGRGGRSRISAEWRQVHGAEAGGEGQGDAVAAPGPAGYAGRGTKRPAMDRSLFAGPPGSTTAFDGNVSEHPGIIRTGTGARGLVQTGPAGLARASSIPQPPMDMPSWRPSAAVQSMISVQPVKNTAMQRDDGPDSQQQGPPGFRPVTMEHHDQGFSRDSFQPPPSKIPRREAQPAASGPPSSHPASTTRVPSLSRPLSSEGIATTSLPPLFHRPGIMAGVNSAVPYWGGTQRAQHVQHGMHGQHMQHVQQASQTQHPQYAQQPSFAQKDVQQPSHAQHAQHVQQPSHVQHAQHVQQPSHAQHAQNVQQLSHAQHAQNVQQPSHAQHAQNLPQPPHAQHAQNVQQPSHAQHAQNVQQPSHAQHAQNVQQPSHAQHAQNVQQPSHAQHAQNVQQPSHAQFAQNAQHAQQAQHAQHVQNLQHAQHDERPPVLHSMQMSASQDGRMAAQLAAAAAMQASSGGGLRPGALAASALQPTRMWTMTNALPSLQHTMRPLLAAHTQHQATPASSGMAAFPGITPQSPLWALRSPAVAPTPPPTARPAPATQAPKESPSDFLASQSPAWPAQQAPLAPASSMDTQDLLVNTGQQPPNLMGDVMLGVQQQQQQMEEM